MAFATKLFRIALSNRFYTLQGKASADFDIQPVKASEEWMQRRNIRMLHHSDGIELVWLSAQYDDPLTLFKEEAEDITLTFVVTTKNDQLFNYSEVEVGHPQAKAYYFHNRHKHGSNLLHRDSFVNSLDLIKVNEIDTYPTEPGWNAFGIIDIDCGTWLAQCEKNKKTLFKDDPPPYEIKIKNRSTIWRYCVIDTKNQLNAHLKVLANGTEAICFSEAQASAETPGTYRIESLAPIGLSDQYDFFFSLCAVEQNKIKRKKTIIERLPCPSHDMLRKDKGNHQKHYSDVVVYV